MAALLAALLAAALFVQLRKRRYTPWIYWLTVVLVTREQIAMDGHAKAPAAQ